MLPEKIGQIGIVVKDVAAAAEYLHKQLGIGPFLIIPLDHCLARYQGEDRSYRLKVGLCGFGGVTIELCQVVEGHPILCDFLPPSGQGVHHIGFYVRDLDQAVAEWQARGGEILQRGSFLPGGGTVYLNSPDHAGMLVELIQMPKAKE
jgi:catechol 2,3-dioxygenase-like lactoylglutathione lyase family enzyme